MTKRRRRILFWTVVVLFGFALVPASCVARAVWFPPTFDVVSIREAPSYQDPALLDRAWKLPVAASYRASLAYQSNGSTCGPASLANVVRSLGLAPDATEASILDGTGKCSVGFCFGGLTLDELAEIARAKTGRSARLIRDISYAEFRTHLPRMNDPKLRYVANFQRGLLFSKGTGHHSPIGGWLSHEDLVFVLDVNENFGPWLVEAKRLHQAMDSVDSSSGLERGLLVIE